MFFLVIRDSSNRRRIGGAALIRGRHRAALINFFVPGAALIRGRRLIEGGAYSSKYGSVSFLKQTSETFCLQRTTIADRKLQYFATHDNNYV